MLAPGMGRSRHDSGRRGRRRCGTGRGVRSRIAGALPGLLGAILLPAETSASGPAAAPEPAPSGVFRLDVRIASRTQLPFYGFARSATVSTYRIEIQRVGSRWVQSHQVCAARIEGGSAFVRTELPDRFVQALERRHYPVTLAPAGSADEERWAYRADMGLEYVGYRPRGPDGGGADELPRAAGDPSVIDWDGDGNPGATVWLSVPFFHGELYVVQRGRSLLEGHLARDGTGEGRVRVRQFGQRVIGARPWFLGRTPSIEPDPERSGFRLSRLPDDATCASLNRQTASRDVSR